MTPTANTLVLDPNTGSPASAGTSGTPPPTTPGAVTAAVANPKNATAYQSQFQLDGTASTSADGKPLTYQWMVSPGSPFAVILGANGATPTVQFDNGYGTYSFTLTVTDSSGKTSTDTATILYLGH